LGLATGTPSLLVASSSPGVRASTRRRDGMSQDLVVLALHADGSADESDADTSTTRIGQAQARFRAAGGLSDGLADALPKGRFAACSGVAFARVAYQMRARGGVNGTRQAFTTAHDGISHSPGRVTSPHFAASMQKPITISQHV
jgi:hypothetical protein